jgi:hypothetical protein
MVQRQPKQDPISKIPNTKRAGGVAQGVGPEFKHHYHKKKSVKYVVNVKYLKYLFSVKMVQTCNIQKK